MCESVDFDKAIQLTGYGKFHYEVFAACALCIISVGFQNGLAAYIFPAAQCELNLSSFQLSILNICFLLGGVVSSFIWGVLADLKGRKTIIVWCHFLNFSVTVICAFVPSIFSLITCRLTNGFLIGAPGSIIFSYLAEFQPPKYRSSAICYSGVFFTLAWLLLPLLAYFILPLNINCITLTSWRVFLIVLVLPELLAGFWFVRLPESPKFFIANGDTKHALNVLRHMFSVNTRNHPKDFPVRSLRTENRDLSCGVLQDMLLQFGRLFNPPLRASTLLTGSIMLANMFGVFGLGWWLPELFIRFERFHALHPNQTATVKQLALAQITTNACKPSFEPAVIRSTLIMGVTTLVLNVLSGIGATRVPLKVILCATMTIGGISAMSIYWLTSSWQNLVIASIFQSTMVVANMTAGSVVVDLFPTSVGGLAICLTMCAGRLGAVASNLIFGLLMDQNCEIPIFVVAASVLLGAVLCFFIPQKKHKTREIDTVVVSNFDTQF